MLQDIDKMFDEMSPMMKHLKKKSYEENTKIFNSRYGHYFQEMTEYIERTEQKEAAAAEIGECLVTTVKKKFTNQKGKIDSRTQVDLNFFMIYYVFPSILKTEHAESKLLADCICEIWGKSFKESNIQYTDYETLHGSFREKIFGIF